MSADSKPDQSENQQVAEIVEHSSINDNITFRSLVSKIFKYATTNKKK